MARFAMLQCREDSKRYIAHVNIIPNSACFSVHGYRLVTDDRMYRRSDESLSRSDALTLAVGITRPHRNYI